MSSTFSDGQMGQLAASLEAADWTPNDVTMLGQAGHDRLVGIRDSLRRGGSIVDAIVGGRTELWFHEDQNTNWVRGRTILAHLTNTGLLAGCANLEELEAIQAKGLDFFRKYFREMVIFGWRQDIRGGDVPCLFESGGEVVLDWDWLRLRWRANYPALRRK